MIPVVGVLLRAMRFVRLAVPAGPLYLAIACAVTLFQGYSSRVYAELPQVAQGLNARFTGALPPEVLNGGQDMVINQVADRATLHWSSFNIGRGHSVTFNQPDSASVALNRIFDSAPSEIRGALTANGRIYLINQNGIVFGDGAQVNTQSLIASTLDIDDVVFEEIGFVNAINEGNTSVDALPAFDSMGNPMGEILLEPGAELNAGAAGRILIFAPRIINEGEINTPEGQTILAASQDKVFLAASGSSDLRGLLVEVTTGGEVTNVGSIVAERGNVTLAGLAVNQQGIARATTSVSLNGSIRLQARDQNGTPNFPDDIPPRVPEPVRGGVLTLADGSVTEVLPDAAGGLASDALAQPDSLIEMDGFAVRLESGSRTVATGGSVEISTGTTPSGAPLDPPPNPVDPGIRIATGAIVDVSGDRSTQVSVARNVIEVEARGNELADSPLQQDGPIRNETLRVDLRRGTDFLDFEAAAAGLERSAGERLSTGGEIELVSNSSVTVEDGALLDIRGGQVEYTEGVISTSKLQTASGTIVDIADADPDVRYSGVVNGGARRESGYLEGKDAGQLSVRSPAFSLNGRLAAAAMAGRLQRQAPGDVTPTRAFARPFDEVPRGGTLEVSQLFVGGVGPTIVLGGALAGPPPTNGSSLLPSVLLNDSGLATVTITNAAGPIIVNQDLRLPAFGSLSLTGTAIDVLKDVRIPGGDFDITTTSGSPGEALALNSELTATIDGIVDLSGTWVNDNPFLNAGPAIAPVVLDGGEFTVDSGAGLTLTESSRIDVSAGAYATSGAEFSGGSGGAISLSTGGSGDSTISAPMSLAGELRGFGFTGGADLQISTGRIRIGASAGGDTLALVGSTQFGAQTIDNPLGENQSRLVIASDTFQRGGFQSFNLESTRADFQIDSTADINLRAAGLIVGSGVFLSPGAGSLDSVASPRVLNAFERRPVSFNLESNNSLGGAVGAIANLRVEPGASISADVGSTVSMASSTTLFFDGTILAPGGDVDLALTGRGLFQPAQALRLGNNARISAPGAILVDPLDPNGFLRGKIIDAGRVAITAGQGSLIGDSGAWIGVDGVAGLLDLGVGLPLRSAVYSSAGEISLTAAESLLYSGGLSGQAAAPTGAAGALTISIDPSSRGVGSVVANIVNAPRGPHTVVLGDFDGVLPLEGEAVDASLESTGFVPLQALNAGGFDSLNVVVRSSTNASDVGVPLPDTPDSLSVIEFRDDVQVNLRRSLTLDAAILRTTDANVEIAAPYVALGNADGQVRFDGTIPDRIANGSGTIATDPIRLTPTAGEGRLTVNAQLLELVGELVTDGFGDATSDVDPGVTLRSTGDLRLRGVRGEGRNEFSGLFRTAADLAIDARRVLPSTLTDFELSVEGAGGLLSIVGGGPGVTAPLSVGGAISFNAESIWQGGAVFAPQGTLAFSANGGNTLTFASGSLTSVSAFGVEGPFFETQPGGDLVLPSVTEDQLVFVESISEPAFQRLLPEKSLILDSPVVELQPGALVDVSGGGDIRATQFEPGPGGSVDVLTALVNTGEGFVVNESFAVLPGISAFAPYDPLESPGAQSVQGAQVGDTIVLADGIDGLPAGEYALLPAIYSLFGGYLVTPQAGTLDLAPAAGIVRPDGVPVVSGRLGVGGNDTVAARSQGFAIESGAQVRRRADYLETPLGSFYDDGILRGLDDAGRVQISADSGLLLQGQLVQRDDASGLGSAVDIATGSALAIVSQATGLNGIELQAADLSALGADSLLIGGTRSREAEGVRISASTDELTVAEGVQLTVPELLLVARDVRVDAAPGNDAVLSTPGTSAARVGDRLLLNDDAAILAVSDRQLGFQRDGNAEASTLAVAADATLFAGGAIIADAGGDVTVAGELDVASGTLNLGASQISLGSTDGQGPLDGLVLSNSILSGLAGSDLRLRAAESVTVFGDVADAVGNSIVFERLSIDSQALLGADNIGASVTLAADTVSLSNTSDAVFDASQISAASGSQLTLLANQIQLGEGRATVAGYESVLLTADTAAIASQPGGLFATPAVAGVLFTGDADLQVAGDLGIEAPIVTAVSAVAAQASASGQLTVSGGDDAAALPQLAGLGATVELAGSSVSFGGRASLSSGNFLLRQADAGFAGGDLDILSGADIDVAGLALDFSPVTIGTPGGSVSLIAETGNVAVAGGASIDVSSSSVGGDAGRLSISAPLGSLELADGALLRAQTAGAAADATVDAQSFAGAGSFAALNNALTSGGFSGARSIRQRQGDLNVGENLIIVGESIELVADSGSIIIDGIIDASGADGGDVLIAAGDRIDLNFGVGQDPLSADDDTGQILAFATDAGGRGGRIELITLDRDGDDPAGATDFATLQSGTLLDVTGGPDSSGGSVLIETRRLDSDLDSQTDQLVVGELAAELRGAAEAQVFAQRLIFDPGVGQPGDTVVVDSAAIDAWRIETENFLAVAPDLIDGFDVTAGINVLSTGSISVPDGWDFQAGWNFSEDFADPANPIPGIKGLVSLIAAGEVQVGADVSDGFVNGSIFGFPVTDQILPAFGESAGSTPTGWNLRIIGGADPNAANPSASSEDDGNVVLAPGVRLRTGTGDIAVVAAGDVRLGEGASIYSAGVDAGLSAQLVEALEAFRPPGQPNPAGLVSLFLGGGQFPTSGGDVSVVAGGTIGAASAPGQITEWLTRLGSSEILGSGLYSQYGAIPTHVAASFRAFENAVGAFGGGYVSLEAGGDISELTLAVPTTVRAVDGVAAQSGGSFFQFVPGERTYEVMGGGDLSVDAGGNLRGVQFVIGDGLASVRSGGDTGPSESDAPLSIYAGGGSIVDLQVSGDLRLSTIQDPATVLINTRQFQVAAAILPELQNPIQVDGQVNFRGDGPAASLAYTYTEDAAVDATSLGGEIVIEDGFSELLIPPQLRLAALGGDVQLRDTIRVFPSPSGQIEFIARDSITGGSGTELLQSDQERLQLPNLQRPEVNTAALENALVPVHANDARSNVFVARDGAITSGFGADIWSASLAKSSLFRAGTDISNLLIAVQNVRDDSVTSFVAGRDIVQGTLRTAAGEFVAPGVGRGDERQFIISGPGAAEFVAGRSIDLGTSAGIESIGNVNNLALADEGASISLLAGLGEDPDYAGFVDTYLRQSDEYAGALQAFLDERGIPAGGDPVDTFESLSLREQRLLLTDILFDELLASGVSAQADGSNDFSGGFAAIESLFPNNDPDGGISLLLSQVQTLDGGDLAFLVPGGDINAGAADADIISKPAEDLGIVTATGGDIDIFVDGDLLVNSTRAFALQGDLLVWSSNGSIDAGRGAKTVTSVPSPITTVNALGQTVTTFPPVVAGSGLQGENAFLFAPRGAVNAGDAGIRTSGNLTIGAVEVIGADNIDVGGVSVGVPTGDAVSVAPPGVADAGSAASRSAEGSASGMLGDENELGERELLGTQVSFITVDVLSFGGCGPDKEDC